MGYTLLVGRKMLYNKNNSVGAGEGENSSQIFLLTPSLRLPIADDFYNRLNKGERMLKRYDKVKYKGKIWTVLCINDGDNTAQIRDIQGNEVSVCLMKIDRYNQPCSK